MTAMESVALGLPPLGAVPGTAPEEVLVISAVAATADGLRIPCLT